MTDAVDSLFAADLSEFVKVRDALVKQLKAEGDKEGAAAVKAMRKPSTVAWAVNQVARQRGDDVAELVRRAGAVRDAQERAVGGREDGSLRTTTRDWRDLVAELGAAAAELVGPQYRDEAAGAFEAASTDEALVDTLVAGRFVAAPTPGGFGLSEAWTVSEINNPTGTRNVYRDRDREVNVSSSSEDSDFGAVVPEPEPVAPLTPPRDEAKIAAARERLEAAEAALMLARREHRAALDALLEAEG